MTASQYLQAIYKRRQESFCSATKDMTVIEAAMKTNMSVAQVSRIRNGLPMCERRARQVEGCLGLAYGSLDHGSV